MRSFRPNTRGVFTGEKPKIRIGGHVNAYSKPTNLFRRFSKLLEGDKPRICFTRKQGGIGDVLMTLPTIKAVSKLYDTKVDYGTDFNYLDGALVKVLQGNPYIDKVLPWHKIDLAEYDLVADLTCPCVAHEKRGAAPINRIDLFSRHVGIRLEDHDIDYQITEDEEAWSEDFFSRHQLKRQKVILVHPSSSTTARDAPVEKMTRAIFKILSRQINTRAIVITHDTDNTKVSWNAHGVIPLENHDVRQIAAIMHRCNLVLCPDSAILHLAAALHCPTVTLFGPTDPNARINHHPEAVSIWPGKGLRNYPCWYEDPLDGYLCWKRLEENSIVDVCIAMLNDKPLPELDELVTFGNFSESNRFYEVV